MGRPTGLEPATSGITSRRSNQLNYGRREREAPSGATAPTSSTTRLSVSILPCKGREHKTRALSSGTFIGSGERSRTLAQMRHVHTARPHRRPRLRPARRPRDRKSVVSGQRVAVRGDLGGRRIIKDKNHKTNRQLSRKIQ